MLSEHRIETIDAHTSREVSPDGRIIVLYAVTPMRMSHEVWSPRVVDAATGQVLMDWWHESLWEGTVVRWDGSRFLMNFRCYPGWKGSATVDIDPHARTFTLNGQTKPLADIYATLTASERRH